jgi:uncharacterized membrane protein YkoI
MSVRRHGVLVLLFALGCGGKPQSDEVVPLDQVPANLLAVAREQLPGYTFDTVYKIKVNGKEAYEIRGKNKQGKIREVEVAATGEVLAVE